MSFSSDVKEELCQIKKLDIKCIKAEVDAFLRFSAEVGLNSNGMYIMFHTSNAQVNRRFLQEIRSLYNVKPNIYLKKQEKLNQSTIYNAVIEQEAKEIIDDFDLFKTKVRTDEEELDDEIVKSYLRAAFLAKGSINNPDSGNYHLEILSQTPEDATYLQYLINHFGADARIVKRRNSYVVYLKKSESILDFIRIVGASNHAFKMDDSIIKRNFVNDLHREVNCEIANATKTKKAAKEQLKYIRYLYYNYPLEKMDPKLLMVMKVRRENPEATFNELLDIIHEFYEEKLTKSGLNHRLRRLKEMALELQEQKK